MNEMVVTGLLGENETYSSSSTIEPKGSPHIGILSQQTQVSDTSSSRVGMSSPDPMKVVLGLSHIWCGTTRARPLEKEGLIHSISKQTLVWFVCGVKQRPDQPQDFVQRSPE